LVKREPRNISAVIISGKERRNLGTGTWIGEWFIP
jgi:hypothetical protein